MPGKLRVRVVAARDLPVMDRASDLADAFAEVRFGQSTYKTEVYPKSLNPQWNSEWFKFEVDDEELQDEPLQIRVMDHDTYSAHDAIGKVYIDLNPLLWKDSVSDIAGWLPIYDTMHGIRGEIYIIVKVDLIEDVNRFRQSSVGIHFFNSSTMPSGYIVTAIHGFVEELVVNDDPEHQWIDMIRSPRASNEARQRLFSKLSGELQRKIGLKVLESEGNAVLGYWQCFDLEGESGVVVRGIGTMATIQTVKLPPPPPTSPPKDNVNPLDDQTQVDGQPGYGSPGTAMNVAMPPSPTKNVPTPRYASDSDLTGQDNLPKIVIDTEGVTNQGSSGSGSGPHRIGLPRAVLAQNNIDMLEYPFFTMASFPHGFLVHLGGMVSTRSVKLLDRIHNPDEPETRDAWWRELRTEIRSHAIAMGCHAVVGYKETTSICEEICLLSASGTAAIVNLEAVQQAALMQQHSPVLTMSLDRTEFLKEQQSMTPHVIERMDSGNPVPDHVSSRCAMCHIPYNDTALPFPVQLAKCATCKRSKVPDVLFTTIEPPPYLSYTGHGCSIQARVCRSKKKMQGEANAALISDALPFMEYELHRQMMNKLKVKGMNCLFGLKVQVTVGETLLVGTATATGVFLSALPPPSALRLSRQGPVGATDKRLQAFQERLDNITAKNKETYGLLDLQESIVEVDGLQQNHPSEESVDPLLASGHRETFVIEIDDIEDTESVIELFDQALPQGFHSCSTELFPGNFEPTQHIQTITMMRRASLTDTSGTTKVVSGLIQDMMQGICFKLRKLTPCCLSKMNIEFALDEDEIIQIWLTAAVVGMKPIVVAPAIPIHKGPLKPSADSEMMFSMEEVSETAGSSPSAKAGASSESGSMQLERKLKIASNKAWRPEVLITPLAIIPGATIERYLGNLNIFFVRETTSVRESGGVSGFMRSFIAEVNAIVRRHVAALGGNALVAYALIDCIMEDNPHKNQCQCLIHVCGDAVHIQYEASSMFLDGSSGKNSPHIAAAPATRS
ncbi:C2 domain-containing protein 5 isoform X3 [Strongylocentrotus purpuratus]|uniref:C2 domain-containing protein n=1 Tax=Strongylocentrotus purpuratus TaxID=7668 RepID=A0A7M7NMH7_STRPU|nr:C2 domain-containing protein 5 isoform X3 [Strongylocentrotus purpuratus]